MKILLTGANGNLGGEIVRVFSAAGHEVAATDRSRLDITDPIAVTKMVQEVSPSVLINTAAYNDVDGAESNEGGRLAMRVNGEAPGFLAQAATQAGIPFVHYSTDYVFDGEQQAGYTEDDQPKPISAYGRSKFAGEQAALRAGGDVYICRLSKIFGHPGSGAGSKEGFIALMLRLASEHPSLKVVDEEVGSPTFTRDIAEATLAMLERKDAPGVYHIVNEGVGVTPYAFVKEVFSAAGVDTPVEPVPRSAFPRAAQPPKFAALLNTKLPPLRERREALNEFLSER